MEATTTRVVVFVANIGMRDVMLDGEAIRQPRPAGEQIYAAFADHRTRLSLPLLAPTLASLQDRHQSVDRILLFATDQREHVAARFREGDTLHFAQIAKAIIDERPGMRGKTSVRLLRDTDPSVYDEALAFYRAELNNPRVRGNATHCYVLASGATPAMNFGLLVASIERFGENCQPLYLREGERRPTELQLGQQLQQTTLRRIAARHLSRYQFAAAADAIREAGRRPVEHCLAEYAAARVNFDWEGALRHFGAALVGVEPDDRYLLRGLREEATSLRDDADPTLLLGELFHRARLAWEGEAYKEFVIFLFALDETALHQIVLAETGIDFRTNEIADQQRRKRQIQESPQLASYLASRTQDGAPLAYEKSTRMVLRAFFDYVLDDSPDSGDGASTTAERRAALVEASAIDSRLNRGELGDLRNRVAHGPGGASRERIVRAYNQGMTEQRDLLADLARLAEAASGRIANWSIDRLREELIRRLEG
jgi:hypothetical protein